MQTLCETHKKRAILFCCFKQCEESRFVCNYCYTTNTMKHSSHTQYLYELEENVPFEKTYAYNIRIQEEFVDVEKAVGEINRVEKDFKRVFEKFRELVEDQAQKYNQAFRKNPNVELINGVFAELKENRIDKELFQSRFLDL